MKSTAQSLAAKLTATKAQVAALFWLIAFAFILALMGSAQAAPVGKITKVSYPTQLLAKKADGRIIVLNKNSSVDNGDMLETQNTTNAEIEFIDGTKVSLGPNTQFTVDNYSYEKNKPQEDHSVFSLIKGTLRSVTGSLGKRNADRYQLNTPVATIGIRGTNYIAKYLTKDDPHATEVLGKRSSKDKIIVENECERHRPSLTVKVIEGRIYLANKGGTQEYSAGQYGCALSKEQAPTVLPEETQFEFNPIYTNATVECKI